MTSALKKLLNLSRFKKQSILVFIDAFLLCCAIIISYSLRQAAFVFPEYGYQNLMYFSPLIAIPIFYFYGLYHAVVRYIGFKASMNIFIAVTVYIILWAAIGYMIGVDVPDSVLIIMTMGTFIK